MNILAKQGLKKQQKDTIFIICCIAPMFLALTIVVFIPIVKAIWMSFFDYRLTSLENIKWNNFGNYISLFKSSRIWDYLYNTFLYITVVVGIELIIAILLALMLNTNIKGRRFFRGILFIPWAVPGVVVGLLWKWLFQADFGLINYILYNLGIIKNAHQAWIVSPNLAIITVMVAAIWRQTPYLMVMILAALQSVDKSLIEAGTIDGAKKFKLFWHVILPSIRPVIDSCITISIIINAQMYVLISLITDGGPMSRTSTFAVAAYKKAFVEYDLGGGSAIGVVLLVLLITITRMYKKFATRNDTV